MTLEVEKKLTWWLGWINSLFLLLHCEHFYVITWLILSNIPGIILCIHPANERWRYIVTSSPIGWAHIQNNPCILYCHPWVWTIECICELELWYIPYLCHCEVLVFTKFNWTSTSNINTTHIVARLCEILVFILNDVMQLGNMIQNHEWWRTFHRKPVWFCNQYCVCWWPSTVRW